MAETRLRGRPAARGLGDGEVVVVGAATHGPRVAGTPREETVALQTAVTTALAALSALAAKAGGEAADILGFQVAMLGDEELSRPALDGIAAGQTADAAWEAALDAEIAGYAAAEDGSFRARAADLQDIRDRVLAGLAGRADDAPVPQGAVVVAARDLAPSRFLAIPWAPGSALVLTEGSPASHVAMLARARGVPMVVGLGGDPGALAGRSALVDADRGEVVLDPDTATRLAFAETRRRETATSEQAAHALLRPAATADGTRVAMHLNIAHPAELTGLDPAICDGIGLVRTEFLFEGQGALPGEDAQYAVYRALADWAQGRPVTIRTLDAGGDKPIAGYTEDDESNPFLGLRGIRLSLRHPNVFRIQLRALARAAMHGAVRIMLPMVTVPDELEAARTMLDEEVAALARDGVAARMPALGMMIEVPAAAIAVERFHAAFFSIGSNDLTQYVTAAARDMGAVAALADPLNPAVLRLITGVVRHGQAAGAEISLCGDAGGEPKAIPHLLACGLRSLSAPPALLARAKLAVASVDLRR